MSCVQLLVNSWTQVCAELIKAIYCLMKHELIGKAVFTFPDHARVEIMLDRAQPQSPVYTAEHEAFRDVMGRVASREVGMRPASFRAGICGYLAGFGQSNFNPLGQERRRSPNRALAPHQR